ncbi:MAG TPA: hypothetical protein VMD27_11265 [Candidatus Aquilonibacter sp.]|nr:hypothetical protein [Candidatus Aquilonibacter sp.]
MQKALKILTINDDPIWPSINHFLASELATISNVPVGANLKVKKMFIKPENGKQASDK